MRWGYESCGSCPSKPPQEKMEAGKARPKSRGEHASRACRLHVPLNFIDATTDGCILITSSLHTCPRTIHGEEEAVRNTVCCDQDFFRSHAGSTISDLIPRWLTRIVINPDQWPAPPQKYKSYSFRHLDTPWSAHRKISQSMAPKYAPIIFGLLVGRLLT